MSGNVVLSFDYEVFFGARQGTLEKCLFEPNRLLLASLAAHNSQAIFFVDAGFVLYLKTYEREKFKKVEQDILSLLDAGHYIELHLHPNWYGEVYSFNEKPFLQQLVDHIGEEKFLQYVDDSAEVLTRIICRHDKSSRLRIFRSAALGLGSNNLIPSICDRIGLIGDSSYAPGLNARWAEYDHTVNNLPEWLGRNIFNKSCLNSRDQFRVCELPLATTTLDFWSRARLALARTATPSLFTVAGDGERIGKSRSKLSKVVSTLRKPRITVPVDIDGISSEYFIRALKNADGSLTSPIVLGHNKLFSALTVTNIMAAHRHGFSLRAEPLYEFLRAS